MNNLKQMYEMQMGKDALTADETTRSPYLNEVIKIVKGLKAGSRKPEELAPALDTLKETIEMLAVTIDVLKESQPASENFENNFARMHELFDLVIEESDTMALYTESQDEKYLDEPLENIKKYINDIFELADDLKKVEDAQPVYSNAVAINEMLRIGYGYMDGTYSLEMLQSRFDIVAEEFEESYTQMVAMENAPKDTEAFAEEYPNIMSNLENMKKAIIALQEVLQTEAPDHEVLKEQFKVVEQVSKNIFEIQQKIVKDIEKKVEEANTRVCPRCGEKTPAAKKYCVKCNAVMPPLPQGFVAPQGDLNVVAGGEELKSAQQEQDLKRISPNVLKVYEVAFKVGRKEIPMEEFLEVVNWYEDIVKTTQANLKGLEIPKGTTEEELQLFNATQGVFMSAIDDSLKALAELHEYEKDENTDHLVQGINQLLAAEDKLFSVNMIGSEAEKKLKEEEAPENSEGMA